LPEHREIELHALIRILEIGTGELPDPLQALSHGVAVQEQRAGDTIHAPVMTEKRLQRPKLLALRLVGERSEDRTAEAPDLRSGTTEHEAVRAEIGERSPSERSS
jgi:hypothetical protein